MDTGWGNDGHGLGRGLANLAVGHGDDDLASVARNADCLVALSQPVEVATGN